MSADLTNYVVFVIASFICLFGAVGVVWSRNPVHSALSLVATLFGIAVLFVQQAAHLLAAVQVIVYTGAIVVLILFVMMLLGIDQEEDLEEEPLRGQRTTAVILGLLLVMGFLFIFGIGGGNFGPATADLVAGKKSVTAPLTTADQTVASGTVAEARAEAVAGDDNVREIGRLLFTKYVFAFEATAALLTIAVVGAVVLARRPKDLQPLPDEPESLDDDFIATVEESTAEVNH